MMKMRVGVFAAAVVAAVLAQAKTWEVYLTQADEQGLTGVHSLTNALIRCAGGDTVNVHPGVYDLSVLTPMDIAEYRTFTGGASASDGMGRQYLIIDNKTIIFKGSDDGHWSEKLGDPSRETILRVTNATAARILYPYAGGGRASKIRNLTLDGGHLPSGKNGGAIYFNDNRLGGYATNCVFANCYAPYGGGTYNVPTYDCLYATNSASRGGGHYGGICNYQTQYVTNKCYKCVFIGNTASDWGGGIYAGSGYGDKTIDIRDCTFVDNTAVNGGGGIYAPTGQDIPRCAFTNNISSAASGGGIYCGARLDLTNCTFVGNSVNGGSGGAAYCGTQGKVFDCYFTNNTSSANGGAFYANARSADGVGVTNCTFIGNRSTGGSGGAIAGNGDCVRMSVFVTNVASSAGGAIYNSLGAEGCWFTNNVAGGQGGAVRSDASCQNNIFVGNTATNNGGALANQSSNPVVVSNSVFIGNTTKNENGGGVWASNAQLSLVNCTFDGNEAPKGDGGAAYCSSAGDIVGCVFRNGKAKSKAGGLCINTISGLIRDCVFNSNTNTSVSSANAGSHLTLARDVVGCTFTGYGDIHAKNFDRCTFNACIYPHLNVNVAAFLTFSRNGTGEGTVRNCLFTSNSVKHVMASEGVVTRFENCTFSDNVIPYAGCLFWAFRYGGSATVSDGIPSTNYIVNCIFANGTKLDSAGAEQPGDISFYVTGTYVPSSAIHIVSNSIYGVRGKDYNGNTTNPKIAVNFLGGKDPKFVKDSAFRGYGPGYMITPTSDAAKAGLVLDWHADGTDLAGNPRMSGNAVSMGAYESNLPEGVYLDGAKYDNLETAVGAAGTSKRIEVIGDQSFDNTQVAAERYFVNGNGYSITPKTPGGDVVYDDASGTLSVGVSDIYELPGDYNVMSGDVAGLVEALNMATGASTIVLSPGVYDLPAAITPALYGGHAYCYLCQGNKQLRLKGACKVNWRERPQERETVLKGGEGGAILYLHAGSGRCSTIYNISFEDGYYPTVSGATCMGGGAISSAGSDGYHADTEQGLVTNCVFRNCGTDYSGGATFNFPAYDCFYSNNYAKVNGGGAYGSDTTGSGSNKNTNHFENCVFVENKTDGSGGALYCKEFEWVKNCAFSNNTAKSYGAGLYSASICGTAFGSTFYNNTNTSAKVSGDFAWGAHAYRVQNFEDCTFGGYGDFQYPRSFVRCTFKGCRTIYPERVQNSNNDSGLITFRRRTSVDETFLIRNCLFDDCEAINLINNSAGRLLRVENCTITGSWLYSEDWQGGKLGHMFFTMRGGVIPDQTPTQYYPSTNVIVNCVFRDNHVYRNTAYERNDIHFFATGTSVPSAAANIVTNCVYETWVPGASTAGQPVLSANFKQSNSINFAKDDPDLAGQYPDYMPKRNSVAHGFGVWDEWMAGAKDLAGADMPALAPVDAGCYQCTLRAPGMMLIFK